MDMTWLAQEAHKLHAIFQNAFFVMLAAFLTIAVALEFLKLPMGDTPAFATLLGRCFMATVFMVALPEIMNMVADTTDSIAKEIGELNKYTYVLERIGERMNGLSFSWTSVRDSVTVLLALLSYIFLYVTVNFADAAFVFCWTLIYVFSPIVFALYVFPQTQDATKGLFKSILEVSLWKITWSVMATLLWSSAVSDINNPNGEINFLTSIIINLMLMISVLMTPKLVRMLLAGGIGEFASSSGGAIMAAASLTPPVALAKAKAGLMFAPSKIGSFAKDKAKKAGKAAIKDGKSFASSTYKNIRNHYSKPQKLPPNVIRPDVDSWKKR